MESETTIDVVIPEGQEAAPHAPVVFDEGASAADVVMMTEAAPVAEEQAHTEGGFLSDTSSWVLFSAIIFAVIVLKKGKQPILGVLDGRSARIKHDLDEAKRLKEEAQALLNDYQAKHRDALQTAQKIIENAQESADLIHAAADKKLQETIARKEAQLMNRISRLENAAINELRSKAADLAVVAAEKLLVAQAGKGGNKLIDSTIEELPKRLAN